MLSSDISVQLDRYHLQILLSRLFITDESRLMHPCNLYDALLFSTPQTEYTWFHQTSITMAKFLSYRNYSVHMTGYIIVGQRPESVPRSYLFPPFFSHRQFTYQLLLLVPFMTKSMTLLSVSPSIKEKAFVWFRTNSLKWYNHWLILMDQADGISLIRFRLPWEQVLSRTEKFWLITS